MKKRFRSEFKRKVALAAIEGKKPLSELSSEFNVHSDQILLWKKEVFRAAKEIFEDKKSIAMKKQEKEINTLYNQIGVMKMEKEFLKKKLKQLGIE